MVRLFSAPARVLTLAASVLVILLFSGVASAQDREADAERLFREGQKLLEERRYGEACPKFEQAYKKDGQLGTLLNLAFCHKEQGANWYAWLEFREAEVKAAELKRGERQEFARKRLDELEKNLPKVIIDNPQKFPLTEVLVEDRRVPEAERGAYFTAEEGKRKFTFRAKGKKSAAMLVNVARGDRAQRVTVPDMEDAPAPTTTVTPEKPDKPDKPDPPKPPPDADKDDPGKTQRILAYTAWGVGGAALVVGSIMGVEVMSLDCAGWGSKCPNHGKNASVEENAAWQGDQDRITRRGNPVTFIFIGASALGVGGVVLYLTAPTSASAASTDKAQTKTARGVAVTPDVGPGWLGVHGSF
jgi:hypothetical protein